MKKLIVVLIFFTVSGFFYYKNIVQYKDVEIVFVNKDKDKKNWDEDNNTVIYVPSKNGKNLNKKIVALDLYKDKREKIIKIFENIKVNSNGYIDDSAEILNVYFEDEKVYVNLNKAIKKKLTGAAVELSLIYSLVNSFVEVKGIDKVKLLIDGEEVKTVGGNIRASDFFEKDDILVKGD